MFNMKLFLICLYTTAIVSLQSVNCISGGKYAQQGQFKYIASVLSRTSSRNFNDVRFCTGSLISHTFVLTAGHCIQNAIAATVMLGSIDITKPYKVLYVRRRSDFFIPSNYRFDYNDIGLIRIRHVKFNNKIYPINLPPAQDNILPYQYINRFAVLSGFGGASHRNYHGHSTALKYMPIKVDDHCWIKRQVRSGFCATSAQYRSISIAGDSGAPLVLNECRVQIGILSTSFNRAGTPMYFTQISKQLSWIKSIVKNLPANADVNFKCNEIFNQNIKPFGGKSLIDSHYTLEGFSTGYRPISSFYNYIFYVMKH